MEFKKKKKKGSESPLAHLSPGYRAHVNNHVLFDFSYNCIGDSKEKQIAVDKRLFIIFMDVWHLLYSSRTSEKMAWQYKLIFKKNGHFVSHSL